MNQSFENRFGWPEVIRVGSVTMVDVPDFRAITVEALADMIRGGTLTATEVTEAAVARIKASNDVVNAFVAVDAAGARAQAASVDARIAAGEDVGVLAGIPIGVKDLEDAVGFRTTRGAMHLADAAAAGTDSTEVARLRAAGCVVIGKTNTPEAGWIGDTFNQIFGATKNPWNLKRSPGGSSGGSSAAVAAGMVPLATGSDGGGSIRIPSGVCGMSSFKPTQGRIPAGPAPLGAADLSTVGPMAQRIRDVALALDVVVGPDANDLRSLPALDGSFRSACDAPEAPTRLLWCTSIDGSPVDDEVNEITQAAIARIRAAGVEVIETDPIMPDVMKPFLLLFYGNMVPGYRHLIGTPAFDEITPGLQTLIAGAEKRLSVDAVERARKAAQALSVRLGAAMKGFDALITPMTVGQTPTSEGQGTVNGEFTNAWVGNTAPFNVTKRPAGTTCMGFASDGMPLALQIVGHQLDDVRVVELTAWAEDHFGMDPVAPFPG
jgi:aspartyl-tRNA(Asn)/glutamyl-tRNA(Gln) amidotransferase subunit A